MLFTTTTYRAAVAVKWICTDLSLYWSKNQTSHGAVLAVSIFDTLLISDGTNNHGSVLLLQQISCRVSTFTRNGLADKFQSQVFTKINKLICNITFTSIKEVL